MHTLGLRSALACAAIGLAALALPSQGAAGQRAYVPDEVVVGIDGEAPRVHRLAPGTTVGEAIAALERDPAVEFAQPNWIAHASLTPLDRGTPGTPGGWAADQWSFLGKPGGIRVARAWDRLIAAGAPGGAGTIVAVVDTGIAHVASAGGFLPSPDFAPGQFVPGIDIVDDDSVAVDENGHGTHVAGTIAEQVTLDQPAAVTDYLTGIAYGARLMPVRVLDRSGAGSATDVGEGILWAARNGADVINVSLQFDAAVTGCEQVPTVCAATREARRLGAFVVAAAGNAVSGKGERRALFPGAAPGVFAVGAITEHGCLAIYSSFRDRTDLLAPGGGQPRPGAARPVCAGDQLPVLQLSYDCFPGCVSGWDRFNIRPDLGTSMSAAHTSGVAALVRASGVAGADPGPKRLAERLTCTARPGPTRRFYAPGLLDALRATDPGRRCARR
jgi:serine protease